MDIGVVSRHTRRVYLKSVIPSTALTGQCWHGQASVGHLYDQIMSRVMKGEWDTWKGYIVSNTSSVVVLLKSGVRIDNTPVIGTECTVKIASATLKIGVSKHTRILSQNHYAPCLSKLLSRIRALRAWITFVIVSGSASVALLWLGLVVSKGILPAVTSYVCSARSISAAFRTEIEQKLLSQAGKYRLLTSEERDRSCSNTEYDGSYKARRNF